MPDRPRNSPPTAAQSLPQTSTTIATLVDAIKADGGISSTQRRDWCSALRRICEIANRDPERVAVDVRELRRAVRGIHPEHAGISLKTLQNIKANTLAALRYAKAIDTSATTRPNLDPKWQSLAGSLTIKSLRTGLSRLMRFCSQRGISPAEVGDEVVDAFVNWLRNETFVKNPNDCHRRTCRLWNEAVDTISGWPGSKVTLPSYRTPRQSIPLTEFPRPFREEIDRHCQWLTGEDLFCEHPPPKACKPGTINHRRKSIELAASALIHRGDAIENVTSLADLVAVDAVKEVLRYYLERRNSEPTQFLRDLLKTLIRIARHWVRVDEEHLKGLKDLQHRMGPDRHGLTDKNRACLRQFDDDHNMALLLYLPSAMVETASKQPKDDVRAAVTAQVALAVELLLMAPMRMGNLVRLRLDQHVIRPGGSSGPVHLVVPGSETKAGEEIEYPLSGSTKEMFDTYLRDYRPRLSSEDGPWLFPAKGGGCKAQSTLSQQLSEAIYKHTGLTITPHQFRHIAAKFLLTNEPGNFEGVRQLLAHRNVKSTTTFYTGLQTSNAARHYDSLLERRREELRDAPVKRRRRRRTSNGKPRK